MNYAERLNKIKEDFYRWYTANANVIFASYVPDPREGYKKIIQKRIDPRIEWVIRVANEKYEEDPSFKDELKEAFDEFEQELDKKCVANRGYPYVQFQIEHTEKIKNLFQDASILDDSGIFSDITRGHIPYNYNLPVEFHYQYLNRTQCEYARNVLELFRFILYNFDANYETCPLCLEEMREPSSVIQCNRCKKWMHYKEIEGLCYGAEKAICWNRIHERIRCPLCNEKWPAGCWKMNEMVNAIYEDSTLGGKKKRKTIHHHRNKRNKSKKTKRIRKLKKKRNISMKK